MLSPINIIATCSDTKTVEPIARMRLRQLPAHDIDRRICEWTTLLSTGHPTTVARNLYAGDHWHTVRSLETLSANLTPTMWVISAGYGLITMDTTIHPYAATFAPQHPDSVCAKGMLPSEARKLWWRNLANAPALADIAPSRSIAAVATKSPSTPMLIIASAPYLEAVADDLSDAVGQLRHPSLLSIISAGTKELGGLSSHLLPCSADVRQLVGGTLTSLNARFAREVLNIVCRDGDSPHIANLRIIAQERLNRCPPLPTHNRLRLSDHEIKNYLIAELDKDPSATHSRLLRKLRDSGKACEQSRFASLHRETRNHA